MFTGLVAGVGKVVAATSTGDEIELSVDLGDLGEGDSIGDSIALCGVCCTVTRMEGATRWFTLSPETIRRTWLGEAEPGRLLNIEKPLRAGDPFGGHVVQGHVDGVARVVEPVDPAKGGELWVEVPADLARYCVEKGSIALDGISLTIAALDGPRIMSAIIPHTAQVTSVGGMAVGDPVHVEVDVLAKYVERLLAARG
jgi:riboflavin synthase